MQDFVRSLGESFQELFRYAYPGFLFLVLLRLAKIQKPFIDPYILGPSYQIWSLIVIALLLSFVVYNLHRWVLHEYLELLLFSFGITAPAKFRKEGKIPKRLKGALWVSMLLVGLLLVVNFFRDKIGNFSISWLWIPFLSLNLFMLIWFIASSSYPKHYKKFIRGRMETKSEELNRYMTIRWATTHALGITWWLPLLFYKYGSQFSRETGFIFTYWKGFWILIGIVFFAWIYQVITLSVVEWVFLESDYPQELW